MYRADTHHRPPRAGSDEVLLISGGEQHILREEILELSRESERETSCVLSSLDAFGSTREDRRGVTTNSAHAAEGRETNIPLHQRSAPSDVGHQTDQEKTEIRGGHRSGFKDRLCQPSTNALPRADVSNTDMRRVDLIGQSVTSMSLAGAVEAITTGEPTTDTNNEAPPLWSLVIRQCQLSSLIPVAGLLHHLAGLVGLRVHEVAGLGLAGVERTLADARCLSTLTISMCDLACLPRLQSGSIEVLDLSDNKLESTGGLEMLFRLKELNLAGNNISTLTDLRPLISLGAGCLRELNLDGNPVQKVPRYWESVAGLLPSIQRLDGVAITRPWRARVAACKITGGCTAIECTTSPRVRDTPVDGYFSDGGVRIRRRIGQGNAKRTGESSTHREGVDEEHGFVRGLAGLGLIWGGIPASRTSRSVCSSPVRASTRRGRGSGAVLFGSTLDGDFGELERSRGVGSATRSSKRLRPPSPARYHQMEADNARSMPRAKAKPRAHWDTSFRRHHHQELAARNLAKRRTARLSRHSQTAIMDRLAQPVRRPHHLKEGYNEAGCAPLPAGDTDLEAWSALFTEAILVESPGLVDRPTALRQPDGQWRGVVSTSTAGESTKRPLQVPVSVSVPALDSQYTGTSDVSTATVPPHNRHPESSTRGASLGPTEELPSTPHENPTTPVSRLQDDRASQSSPSQLTPPQPPPPPRATLILPDAMTVDDQADLSGAVGPHDAGHTFPKAPNTPLGDGRRRRACGGQSIGARSAMSSPRSECGCRERAAPCIKGQPESRPRSSPTCFSPLRTRTPRVLKTSKDFAQTIRRVYKIDVSEEEAKSLFQLLDTDRDGALGAEDLLRGAPTVASFLSRTQSTKPDGLSRQGSQNTACAGRAWNRNAARREVLRRSDARCSSRRVQYHQREAPMRDDSLPRRISASGDEGIEFQASTRSTFGEGIPRRLEDWRIPEEKRSVCELRDGTARGQFL